MEDLVFVYWGDTLPEDNVAEVSNALPTAIGASADNSND